MAAFLFVAGRTGAVISWNHELDEWLNPQLFGEVVRPCPWPASSSRASAVTRP